MSELRDEPEGDERESELGLAIEGPAPAAQRFYVTEPKGGILLRRGLGAMSGVLVALALTFILPVAVPGRDFSSSVDSLRILLVLFLGYAGASLAARWFPPSRALDIVVGVDGVLVRGRFIHHSEIDGVRREWKHEVGSPSYDGVPGDPDQNVWSVFLDLVDGEVLTAATGSYSTSRAFPEQTGVEIVRAIEEAQAAWDAGRQSGDVADEDMVARGELTASEWIEALRRLGTSSSAVYRDIAIDTDAPSRLLDDAQARPSARAAAAIVLTESGDTTGITKLRIASKSMANPRLRVAMMNVTNASDDADLAEALEVLDEMDREEQA